MSRIRFLHYSVDDEEYYRRFGKFPANTEFDLEALPPPPSRLNAPAHVPNAIDPYAYGQYSCTTSPEKRWPPPPLPPPTQTHMYRSSYSTQFDHPQQQMPLRHVDYGSASVHRRQSPPQDYQMRHTNGDQYGANEANGLEQPIGNYRQPTIQQQQQQQQHNDKNMTITGMLDAKCSGFFIGVLSIPA